MLILTLDTNLSAGRTALPEHLGGVLHGFVERSILNHAPHLMPILRPADGNIEPHYALMPPHYGARIENRLRFGLKLFSKAEGTWLQFARALMLQRHSGIEGRSVHVLGVHLSTMAGETVQVASDDRWHISAEEEIPHFSSAPSKRFPILADQPSGACPVLTFGNPMTLGSRHKQRSEELLPWPSLGSILSSIAKRIQALEPELAAALQLPPHWRPPAELTEVLPFISSAAPATRWTWRYKPSIPIPVVTGTLAYPAIDIAFGNELLYLGQWMGVGGRAGLGFGHYVLSQLKWSEP